MGMGVGMGVGMGMGMATGAAPCNARPAGAFRCIFTRGYSK